MVSRGFTVLLMGLIALSTLHLTHGVPIVEDNRDKANQDYDGKDEVAKIEDEQAYRSVAELINAEQRAGSELETPKTAEDASSISDLISYAPNYSLLSALQRDEVEYSPNMYATDASTTLLNSVYEPILYYSDLDSLFAENMYIDRYPRDASQSKQALKKTCNNPYAYGLARLPDTEVLNSKECVEHHLTHLEPTIYSKHPQLGRFIKRRRYNNNNNNNALDKVCEQECILNQLRIYLFVFPQTSNAFYHGPVIILANSKQLANMHQIAEET